MSISKYAENAEECFRMALVAKDQEEESAWLGLGRSWLQLGRWGLQERAKRFSGILPAPAAGEKTSDLVRA